MQRATDLIDKLTEHLLDMNPHHELSREVFADRLMARGQYEEAATVYGQLCFDFTAAVAGGSGILTPDHVKIGERWHIKASKAIIGNDDTEIALQTLGQLDYSNPEEVHYLMGTAHAMEQRYEDAASHLNEALAVEKPDVRRDNIALGVVYSQTGKLDEALQCWKKAYDGEKDAVFDKLTEPITFSRDEVRKIMMEEVDLAEYVAAR